MMFAIPEKCGLCNKKKKGRWIALKDPETKKQGNKLIIGYTPMAYLCEKCIEEL